MWAVFALGAACGHKKEWIEIHATQLHVGTLEADIPSGWRDINELVDKSNLPKVPAGTRVLLHEDLSDYGEIMVFEVLAPITGDGCEPLAKALEAQSAGRASIMNVESAMFAGNPGCMMDMHVDNLAGRLRVVTPRGGSTVGVRCLGRADDRDLACDKIVYGLHPTKPATP